MAPPLNNLTNPNTITADGDTVDATSWVTDWSTVVNYINSSLTASFNNFANQGDILCYNGSTIQVLSGSGVINGYLLSFNSGVASGLQWIAPPGLPWTTDGDLVYFNGSSSVRLPIGSASEVLTVAGGVPAWVAPGGLPVGTIVLWSGALNTVPTGWGICDGVSNASGSGINLQGLFVVGAGAQSPPATGGMGLINAKTVAGDTSSGSGVGASYTPTVATGAAQKGTNGVQVGKSGPTTSIVVTPRYMALAYIELLP